MRNDLKDRTKKFAIAVCRMTEGLVKTRIADIIARQIIRSASSTAANYRATQRAKSDRDFINKLATVQEEVDETLLWLEMISELELFPHKKEIDVLHNECTQLLSIMTAALITAKLKKTGNK